MLQIMLSLLASVLLFSSVQAQGILSGKSSQGKFNIPIPKRWESNVRNQSVTKQQKRLILRISVRKFFEKHLAPYGDVKEPQFQSWIKKRIDVNLERMLLEQEIAFPAANTAVVNLRLNPQILLSEMRGSKFRTAFRLPQNLNKNSGLFSKNAQVAGALLVYSQDRPLPEACAGLPELSLRYGHLFSVPESLSSSFGSRFALHFLKPLGQSIGALKMDARLCDSLLGYLARHYGNAPAPVIEPLRLYHPYFDSSESVKTGVVIVISYDTIQQSALPRDITILKMYGNKMEHTWWSRALHDPMGYKSGAEIARTVHQRLGRAEAYYSQAKPSLSGVQLSVTHGLGSANSQQLFKVLSGKAVAMKLYNQFAPHSFLNRSLVYQTSFPDTAFSDIQQALEGEAPQLFLQRQSQSNKPTWVVGRKGL